MNHMILSDKEQPLVHCLLFLGFLIPAKTSYRRHIFHQHIKNYSRKIKVTEFVPKKVKITTDENATKEEPSEYTDEDEEKSKKILKTLLSPQDAKKYKMNPIVFEKDNDKNYHIDFIHAAANLRASAYGIKTVTRLDSKLIAGKIVPAIVTTTAVVVGFGNLELYKIYGGNKKN